jgi:hypothetical protein
MAEHDRDGTIRDAALRVFRRTADNVDADRARRS